MSLPLGNLLCPDLSLRIYLAGPGFGEAIILVFGGRLVVGVDCCAEVSAPINNRSSIYRILERLGPKAQLYWILTHYHHDHFQGLAESLSECRRWLRGLVVPYSYTSADILYEIKTNAFSRRKRKLDTHQAVGEYERLRGLVSSPEFGSITTVIMGSQGSSFRLRRGDSGSRTVRLRCFGPRVSSAGRHQVKALQALGRDFEGHSDRRNANESSYIVMINSGDLLVALLGDCPVDRILRRVGGAVPAWSRLVLKVSHHGSRTGTDQRLLTEFSSAGRECAKETIALVTPYASKRLPKSEVLKQLEENGYQLFRSQTEDSNLESDILLPWLPFGSVEIKTLRAVGRTAETSVSL